MEKFKFMIGDKVVANKEADRYYITNTGWQGYVVKVYDYCYIEVSTNPEAKGGFKVLAECFDKVGSAPKTKLPCARDRQTDSRFEPLRILRHGNATIVFWNDGTKTVVKCAADEPDNDYAAFTAALGIKLFGSNSALKRMLGKKVERKG